MLRKFLKLTPELKGYYAVVTSLTIVTALLAQAGPVLTRSIIDELTNVASGSVDRSLVLWLVVAMFAAQLLGAIINNISGYFGDILTIKLKANLSQRYYEKLLNLPQAYFDNHMTGEVINKLTRSIEELTQFVKMFINNLLSMILTSLIALVIIARYSPWISLLLLSLYPSVVLITRLTSKHWQRYQDKINAEGDIATGRFTEVVSQVKVVRVFARSARELGFFSSRYKAMESTTRKQSRLWHRDDILRQGVLNIIFFVVMLIMVSQAASGVYSVGVLVMLTQFVINLRFPITGMSFFVDSFQRAKSGTKDYFEILDLPEAEAPASQAVVKIKQPSVKFDGVSFSYDSSEDCVLKDVSFELKPGSKTALIGESGSGKSTIASLVMMLYRASSGEIYIGEQKVSDNNFVSLRDNISVVFQDASLFSGTIRENIAYGQANASDKEVEQAAQQANAHDFIMQFDKGYKTVIGERGLKLSGGQKQRIAIARALLRDAPILILDEATSSLDSRSEAVVQKSLDFLMQGRTTLIIAHRLSTIAGVDQVITLDTGEVKEIGPPKDLAKSGGIYQQLLELQAGAGENEELKAYDIAG